MRSIFFAMAIAAIATISTGCTMSCKFSGPCRTLSKTCSIDQGGANCTSCATNNCGGNCGSTTCNVIQPLGQNVSGGCDDGCPDGLMGGSCATGNSGLFGGGNRGMGMGLFQKGAMCSTADGGCGESGCDGGCGGAVFDNGMSMGTGMGPGIGGGLLAGNGPGIGGGLLAGKGCGNFGCGQGGRLCLGCKWRGGRRMGGGMPSLRSIGHPYGGQVPHTPAPSYGGMGGAGGGTPSYAYPYYTTRGPRDFLNGNPPSIGR